MESSNNQARLEMNRLGKLKIPFLFILDYPFKSPIILPLNEINNQEILYRIKETQNFNEVVRPMPVEIKINPPDFQDYLGKFNQLKEEFKAGNTYLTNLTVEVPIQVNQSLKDIFLQSFSPYKLYLRDQFVVFSPESFIQVKNGMIFTYPMKGTINGDQPDAEKTLMNDPKEIAEHVTVVDLLRNDISVVAKDVQVLRFRYLEKIQAMGKNILQTSSEIRGELPTHYPEIMGDIICSLLPAGSITGAPKMKTVEIIEKIEQYARGYYTGVFGLFDGLNLDSCVMIRFIEKNRGQMYFKTGGGVTIYSDPRKEYEELLEKIYVPIR
jgi:para-aminobenzoate synthetase component 1